MDISTGDVITPNSIEYQYQLLLEERKINILSYNIETVLAEKLETILSRGVANTRMRDFYDIYMLWKFCRDKISVDLLGDALEMTVRNRQSEQYIKNSASILTEIMNSEPLHQYWNSYQQSYEYASTISFFDASSSAHQILLLLEARE